MWISILIFDVHSVVIWYFDASYVVNLLYVAKIESSIGIVMKNFIHWHLTWKLTNFNRSFYHQLCVQLCCQFNGDFLTASIGYSYAKFKMTNQIIVKMSNFAITNQQRIQITIWYDYFNIWLFCQSNSYCSLVFAICDEHQVIIQYFWYKFILTAPIYVIKCSQNNEYGLKFKRQ